jgi:hypothetical protein
MHYRIVTSQAHGSRPIAVSHSLAIAVGRVLAAANTDCSCGGCLVVVDDDGHPVDLLDLDDDVLRAAKEYADALREVF